MRRLLFSAMALSAMVTGALAGTASAQPATAPGCYAVQLTAGLTAGTATDGRQPMTLKLTNIAHESCSLSGQLGIRIVDIEWTVPTTTVRDPGSQPVITLAPGGAATVHLTYSPSVAPAGGLDNSETKLLAKPAGQWWESEVTWPSSVDLTSGGTMEVGLIRAG